VALLAALIASGLLIAAGLPENLAEALATMALLVYAVALHGFVIRRALELSQWRTAAMVIAINLGTAAVVLVPTLVNDALEVGG